MNDAKKPSDAALEASLARALGPDAEDTAPLSRAVLNRMVEQPRPARLALAEVLADPRPVGGLFLGALLLAGALGYAMVPADLEEVFALTTILRQGF
jgi:hypothetical protein